MAGAHQQAPAFDWLVEPLVRIQGYRIGELDSRQRGLAALGEGRETTVGGVDVQPQSPLVTE